MPARFFPCYIIKEIIIEIIGFQLFFFVLKTFKEDKLIGTFCFVEKLRRKDLEVSKALEEKQRLIADILHIPIDDFDNIVDIASQPSPDRDAREVLLAALAQGESTISTA